MEKKIFPAPAVAEILSDMVEARLHTDGGDATSKWNRDLQLEMTSSVANPVYVVQDPVTGSNLVGEMKKKYMDDATTFAAFLSRAQTRLAMGEGEQPEVARSSR